MAQPCDDCSRKLLKSNLLARRFEPEEALVADGAARWSEVVDGVITEISAIARVEIAPNGMNSWLFRRNFSPSSGGSTLARY